MPDYQNGKIYKLWSLEGDDIYIGSTTQSLAVRKAEHKRKDTCYSKILFEKYDDVKIELIEEYPCKNKMELNKREGYYIRNNECVNKSIAGRTKKEYDKKYREENKEKISEKRSQIITCECGCEISIRNLAQHKHSKKHINFIQQQQASQESQVLN